MNRIIIFLFGCVVLFSCKLDESIDDPEGEKELLTYPIIINSEIIFGEEDLPDSRNYTTLEEPVYFFIGVFEVSQDSFNTNPHTRQLLYANGGFRSIPDNLTLSLFTNTKYTIQTLAIKKSNLYGVDIVDYEYEGEVYDRLHLAWDVNSPEPAVLTDSISYTDLWMEVSNGGVGGFDNGYIYADEDSTSLIYTWPLMANTYYESKQIETTPDLGTIEINPVRSVFGVKVIADGISDSTFIELQVGNASDPLIVKPEDNGEIFIYAAFGSYAHFFKVSKVIIDETGDEISTTLYSKEYFSFTTGKTTVIEVSLTPATGKLNSTSIDLIEVPLEEGDTVKIQG